MPYIPEFTYEDHLIYKIKKNDTLINVAKQLVIKPYDLRSYHNKFCPLQDLIEADFPNHLRYVILAPEKMELSDDENDPDENIYLEFLFQRKEENLVSFNNL